MTTREVISSPNAPAAIGPYSQAIKHGGVLYVSGCIGIEKDLGSLVEGGVAAQTRQSLINMRHIIEAGGSTMSNVLKCTVLLTDMSTYSEVNAVYGEFFPSEPPARAAFAVSALPAGALVEIECICAAE
eukprot:CAMPEP_0185025612 /NCGR_PEP_ID=MMETSP1103-20130426/8504_1 /TAXON_ID=36769 /ORGANISM="Paraphysomonas bandaiensis, Strain Caron Lab Isolate" /LENGTH=128 /DNA_ID=CAMNT_0027558855 /DNA_START=36 /DNA_END=422 /DNA_ORIENTATION=-